MKKNSLGGVKKLMEYLLFRLGFILIIGMDTDSIY